MNARIHHCFNGICFRYTANQILCTFIAAFVCFPAIGRSQSDLPSPGIGLLISAEELPEFRARLEKEPWKSKFSQIKAQADQLVEQWPEMRKRMDGRIETALDLTIEFDAVTKDAETRELIKTLAGTAQGKMCPAAFAYLITGDERYAHVALDVMRTIGRVNRWGWFNWPGVAMPQIHAGMFGRNTAFTLDFIWDSLTEEERQELKELIAEKVVEPYFRLNLHAPAMGLMHLRSKNQGSNVFAGAMIGCLVLGDDYPNAKQWRRSFVQTYHWLITHDIGWAGQGLESGMPGYWSVSMQNLYTAAVCLRNVTGIDLRSHPGFAEATYYPLIHETTVPPVGGFDKPIDPGFAGATGIIAGKPIELPADASGSTWWYDYALHHPESAAAYFVNRSMISITEGGTLNFYNHNAHQSGHSQIIGLLWTHPSVYREQNTGPSALFKTTDRMTMIRSGYGMGHTYMYVNGDVFLSALGEILGTTGGLSWHFKWHGYQKAETGVETEGEELAPSMVVTGSWDDDVMSVINTRSGPSNITYYRPQGHNVVHQNYIRRDRDIIYIRDEPGKDYFIFVDHVSQKEPKWHGWLWQSWNQVYQNNEVNRSAYQLKGDNQVRLLRPNADLQFSFIAPGNLEFEVEDAPGQPKTAYMMDHNLLTLRALAGGYEGVDAKSIEINPDAWTGLGELVESSKTDADANGEIPTKIYRINGRENLVKSQDESLNGFVVNESLRAGLRYRMRMQFSKTDLAVYENLAWRLNFSLLNQNGDVVLDGKSEYQKPSALSMRDPRSFTKTTPWLWTRWVYFDVSKNINVSQIKGALLAGEYSHPPTRIHDDSVLEIGSIEIEPVGVVERKTDETFVAVLHPLKKGTDSPAMVFSQSGGARIGMIKQTEFAQDWIIANAYEPTKFQWGSVVAELAWVRVDDDDVVTHVYLRKAEYLELEGQEILKNAGPLDISIRLTRGGQITSIRASVDGATEMTMFGRTYPLGNGFHVAGENLRFQPDESAASVESNTLKSQETLRDGLAPLIAEIIDERDSILKRNHALGAKVTASGYRDGRFPPSKIIDDKTWELPADGRLDYTQEPLFTTGHGGYGMEKRPLFGHEMESFPFYVRPTYWLLPYGKPGWVQLDLPRERQISLVRVLNTSNAGLNDYATMKFRVQLLDESGTVVDEKHREFGKALDRPFEQAFKYPKHFGRYGATFDGMLEPGIKVPFGDGWQDIEFNSVKAHSVKILIDSFWAIGGGLNEVQIYE